MSAITPHYRTISQLLQGRKFSIDEYQREYKWGHHHMWQETEDIPSPMFVGGTRVGLNEDEL
ncbi:hypothetical protein E3O53_12560 [Cryobacterium sp. TMT2-18-3]|nr:hypothetical protein E3O22_08625 [Cryobacterium sp. TMT2-18-2]TFC62380.1 hypothetical protein E3O53_12560 [Cryobacterium sp. TMT2-18-3]